MNSHDKDVIRQQFDDYLRMYAACDDSLKEHFSNDFAGITCSGDGLVKNQQEWFAVTRQDFTQDKQPLRIELKDVSIQLLADTVAVGTGVFSVHLALEEATVLAETARLVLVFRKEANAWKIAHSSISTPNPLLKDSQAPVLQALIQRNRALEQQINQQSQQLLEANNKLAITREQLKQAHIEHQQAEDALRKSEGHFRMMTENVVDVVWKLDKEYRFTYISPADEKRRGYRADEVIGHHVFEMFDEEGIESIKRAAQQRHEAEAKGVPLTDVTFEARHRCKDGSWIWGEIRYNPEFDAKGNVIGFYGISREITERKQMQDQVRQLAFYDPLTLLPNRHLLNERLNQAMAANQRKGRYAALMFLDLDNFKPINDIHGHSAGDLLLFEVGQRLKKCVREMDTVARFGGDEFIVVLSELETDKAQSIQHARHVADKVRTTLAEVYRLNVNYADKPSICIEHTCTVSIGVALFLGQEISIDDLLKRADISMYQAKESGRNAMKFYTSEE